MQGGRLYGHAVATADVKLASSDMVHVWAEESMRRCDMTFTNLMMTAGNNIVHSTLAASK